MLNALQVSVVTTGGRGRLRGVLVPILKKVLLLVTPFGWEGVTLVVSCITKALPPVTHVAKGLLQSVDRCFVAIWICDGQIDCNLAVRS